MSPREAAYKISTSTLWQLLAILTTIVLSVGGGTLVAVWQGGRESQKIIDGQAVMVDIYKDHESRLRDLERQRNFQPPRTASSIQ